MVLKLSELPHDNLKLSTVNITKIMNYKNVANIGV